MSAINQIVAAIHEGYDIKIGRREKDWIQISITPSYFRIIYDSNLKPMTFLCEVDKDMFDFLERRPWKNPLASKEERVEQAERILNNELWCLLERARNPIEEKE